MAASAEAAYRVDLELDAPDAPDMGDLPPAWVTEVASEDEQSCLA